MSNLKNKVIVTVALTGGIHVPSMSPYLPWKHQDLIKNAVDSYNEGASMVHVHGRNQTDGRPSADLEDFRIVLEGIKKSTGDMVMIPTTGGGLGQTPAQRVNVVTHLRPEMASFTPGSCNFDISGIAASIKEWKYDWEKTYVKNSEDFVFSNSSKTVKEFGAAFRAAGTRPEFEIFEVGMLRNLSVLIQQGHLDGDRLHLQFVLGIMGAMPAEAQSIYILHSEAKRMLGDHFTWSVCCGGRQQMSLLAAAMAFGAQNVRVGLEDSLYLERGVLAKSNAECAAKIVRIARELGREIATPAEAREIIGLKGIDKVSF